MGLINLVFDCCFLVLLVRAVVPNEGHMAFNRPYQRIIGVLEPIWTKLKVHGRQAGQVSWLILLVLVGFRGILWSLYGTNVLDFKVIVITASRANLYQSQALSFVAVTVFLLQVYAFITLAIAIGGLENRTDHYSRLMRALLGPLKKLPPAVRCIVPAVALVLFWSVALWSMVIVGLVPEHRLGTAGCALGAVPITLALIVDLARIWIVLIIVRAILSFVPVWRPPVVDVIERMTDPALKPLQRFKLKAGNFDLGPLVAVLILVVLRWAILFGLERAYIKL